MHNTAPAQQLASSLFQLTRTVRLSAYAPVATSGRAASEPTANMRLSRRMSADALTLRDT